MADANEVRLQLAHENAAVYAANPNVKAVLLTGSVARGYADDKSDIDTLILYGTPPLNAEFDQICSAAKQAGGGLIGGTPGEGFAVYYYAQGVKCDFAHGPVELEEQRIAAMLATPGLDSINHIILSGLVDAIALHGGAWFEPLRAKLRDEYPVALGEMMVEKHLSFQPRWVLEKMGVDRAERLFLYESYLASTENILGMLYGLNRRYHPGKLKGVAWVVDQMTIKPPELLRRLEQLFQLEPRTAVAELYSLIEETLALVERHRPNIDTSKARDRLGMVLRR
jgi:hypothetical protein